MLLGQDGGGHQDGRLLPVQHAFHHRPQGHLRLPVAHVAAEQPVHGDRFFHILFDIRDTPELVVGLRVVEGLLKLLLPGGVRGEGKAGAALPLGVQGDEALGQVLGRGLGPGLLLGPVGAAQLVQPRGGTALLIGGPAAADVLAHQVQGRGGDVEAVSSGIGDLDIVLLHPVHGHLPDALKAADAVVDVDHQVPGGQVGVAEELLPVVLPAGLGGRPASGGGGGELSLGEHRQVQLRVLRTGGEGPHGDTDLPRGGHGPAVEVQGRRQVPALQHPLHVPAPALASAEKQHGKISLPVVLQVSGGGINAPPVGAQLFGVHRQERLGRQGIPGGGQGLHHAHRETLQGLQPLALREEQARQVPVLLPRRQEGFRILLGLPEDVFHPLGHPPRLAQAEKCVRRQAVEAGRQSRLRQKLRRGQEEGAVQVFRPALGGGVEGAQGVDLIVEELAPHRLLHEGGEHVQDAPPQGELPHALYLVRPGVPGGGEAAGQVREVAPLPHFQRNSRPLEGIRGAGLLQEALRRTHQHQGPLLLPQPAEGPDPAQLPLPGDDRPRPHEELPGKEPQGAHPQQGLQVLRQAHRVPLVVADHHQGTPRPLRQRRPHLGAVDAPQARHCRGALPPLHRLHQALDLRDTQEGVQ